jgi:hypothetical protein
MINQRQTAAAGCYGRGTGVGRGLGVKAVRGVGVGLGVEVGVGLGVLEKTQYLPPVFNNVKLCEPPQTIISMPVQTVSGAFVVLAFPSSNTQNRNLLICIAVTETASFSV